MVKNLLAVTMLSMGMPMILMGDEVRRTQHGNNNGYCHDNEINWFDWTLLEKHADVHRFVSMLSARRSSRSIEHERQRLTLNQLIQRADKTWHGVKLNEPDWGDGSHSIALTMELQAEKLLVHMILNAYSQPLDFELPHASGARILTWRRWIDTALETPQDIVPWQDAPCVKGRSYRAADHSVIVLFSEI